MQKKKGISLIVLVITIIVMIILAAAIILSINNNNVVDKAKDAVDQTNYKQIQELAQVAWAEAYAGGKRTQTELNTYVQEYLVKSEAPAGYYVEVTTKGVTVHEVETGKWQKIGTTITNGKQVLQIGDTISYVATGSNYTGTWKLLGLDDKGRLKIVSSDVMEKLTISSSQIPSLYSILKSECEIYGNGEKAAEVRSITAEDVNDLTGYVPETAGYKKGTISEYGITVEYYWVGDETPYYIYNGEGQKSTLSTYTGNFYYMSNDAFVAATKDTSADMTNKKLITKAENTAYSYTANELIDEDTAIYDMLFNKLDNSGKVTYFLANPVAYSTTSGAITYSFLCVGVGKVDTALSFTGSTGAGINVNIITITSPYRPVVILEEDTELTGSSSTGWNIKGI